MKSEAEPFLPINTAAVWAGEKPANEQRKNFPGTKIWLAILGFLFVAGMSLVVWSYSLGLKEIESLKEQLIQGVSGSVAHSLERLAISAQQWGIKLCLASAAAGALLFVAASAAISRLRKTWVVYHTENTEAFEMRAHKLLGQLADTKVSQEEARTANAELQVLLANVSQRHASLEKELDQHKQTEKTLSQQTVQLERSKDVLEMHVQARTQELAKMQRRNESILNSAADGICGFDLQGRATFINPMAAKYTGWKIEEILGKTEEVIFFPAKARGSKDAPGFLKDEAGRNLPEQMLYRKDGSVFSAEYTRAAIMENDKPVGWVVVFKDITERKLAEDKLNHKAAELARSNRELEQFAFVASHDLQEPLRKIQAFGDRLKIKCESVQLEEGKDYLERMQSAAARMQTLINDLLTFSRVISASQPFVNVDLTAVTQEVLVDLEVRVEKTGAQIQVGKLPAIQADPMQMRQLMQNLIGNALKFQAPGAVPNIKIDAQLINRDQIQEDTKLPKPPPTARPEDKFCVITIEDNGIGFEEQYLEKIFAVFQRLHGRSEYEGTGVGLAVCRRITDRHGGLITAQSKPDEGSVFVILLPMEQPATEVKS